MPHQIDEKFASRRREHRRNQSDRKTFLRDSLALVAVVAFLGGALAGRTHREDTAPYTNKTVTARPHEYLWNIVTRAEGNDQDVIPEINRLEPIVGDAPDPGTKVTVRVKK
jgi:hypothetical protein